MVYIIVGIFLVVLGIWAGICTDYFRHFLCGMCLTSIGALIALFGIFITASPITTYYLEAEPIAYNTDTTIFSTPNGYYTANAIYDEDTVYLLTMNSMGTTNTKDDEILVVWKCDEGSVG